MRRIKTALLALICGLCVPTAALAAGSGGFRVELPDAAAFGMGSAFVGEADTASAVYYNPAGMTQVEGNQVKLGTSLLQPFATHRNANDDKTDATESDFNIPHFYAVSDLGTENFAVGVSAGSSWGLVTEWADDSFSKYLATRTELTSKDYSITGAYALNEQWSFAVSADYNRTDLIKNKKLAQTGGNDAHFLLRQDSDAWGYRLATHFRLNEQHKFGFMYRSKIEHKLQGRVELSNLNTFGSNYQTIFGGTDFATSAELKSTYPQSMIMGYSFQPNSQWTFNADLEWMDWSSIRDELLTYPDVSNATQLAVLNAGNPVHHDWTSVFSFGMGTEYKATDKLRLRTGYYYHETPIPDDTFESSLPDSDSHAGTIGFGYDLRKDLILDMAYSAIFYKDRVIDNPVVSGGINGEYEQWTSILMASITMSF